MKRWEKSPSVEVIALIFYEQNTKTLRQYLPNRVNPRPAGSSPTPALCWGGGGRSGPPIYLGNQKTWRNIAWRKISKIIREHPDETSEPESSREPTFCGDHCREVRRRAGGPPCAKVWLAHFYGTISLSTNHGARDKAGRSADELIGRRPTRPGPVRRIALTAAHRTQTHWTPASLWKIEVKVNVRVF